MATTVRYGRVEFRAAVEQIAAAAADGDGVCILFMGGTSEARREALAQIAENTASNLHQHDGRSLIGENMMQTQGNIREAFDTAVNGTSLLYLENADAVFHDARYTRDEEDLDSEAHTGLNYLFQRIDHYSGIMILHGTDSDFAEAVNGNVADFVIEF